MSSYEPSDSAYKHDPVNKATGTSYIFSALLISSPVDNFKAYISPILRTMLKFLVTSTIIAFVKAI